MNKSLAHQHIILIGMMGAGKSTVGQKLSSILNRPFVDLDHYIESKQSETISTIFQQMSIENFRIMEEKYCLALLQNSQVPIVLALGGGTFSHRQTLDHLHPHITIYLECDEAALLKRLENETHKRPLIQGLSSKALKGKLESILLNRTTMYEQSQHKINVSNENPEIIALKLQQLLRSQ